jgi:hypothetical protein
MPMATGTNKTNRRAKNRSMIEVVLDIPENDLNAILYTRPPDLTLHHTR